MRSKQIHYVTVGVPIVTPDDPEDPVVGEFDVSTLLSQKFGTNIANGLNYRLVGYGASMTATSGDQDMGLASMVALAYCPPTKHSVKAWQKVHQEWKRQKTLRGRSGSAERYDDFVVGFTGAGQITGQSSIYAGGLADTDGQEEVALYGTAVSGSLLPLDDWYNNRFVQPAAGTDTFGNALRAPKWATPFPTKQYLHMSATWSAMLDATSIPDDYGGAMAQTEMHWLPTDNHISHMTGTLQYLIRSLPADTAGQAEDSMMLVLTLAYEGWSSLLPKPKARARRGSGRRTPKRTYRSKSKSSGYRRYRRRG